jgi:hypothetical protein
MSAENISELVTSEENDSKNHSGSYTFKIDFVHTANDDKGDNLAFFGKPVDLHKRRYIQKQSSVDIAFELIGNVIYGDFDEVERSNIFDEWKERIISISENSSINTVPFRQILGMLLFAINKKDIIDFSKDALFAFQEANNYLRISKHSMIDINKVYKRMNSVGLVVSNNIVVSDFDEMHELDNMIDRIISEG